MVGACACSSGRDGAQLVTAPQAAEHVETFLGLEASRRLSRAALETLAIVAYRQPVTRATIESVRGVQQRRVDRHAAVARADRGGRAGAGPRPAGAVRDDATLPRTLRPRTSRRICRSSATTSCRQPTERHRSRCTMFLARRASTAARPRRRKRWRGGGRTPDDARPQTRGACVAAYRRPAARRPGRPSPEPSSHGPLPDGGRAAVPGGGSPAF